MQHCASIMQCTAAYIENEWDINVGNGVMPLSCSSEGKKIVACGEEKTNITFGIKLGLAFTLSFAGDTVYNNQ